jgi:hypothetical protein
VSDGSEQSNVPTPGPKYTPVRKKALQKTGEFLQTAGTGTSGLSAVQVVFADTSGSDGLLRAGFILLGLGLVVTGIYLQAEAER